MGYILQPILSITNLMSNIKYKIPKESKRYHCEFKNCFCKKFKLHCNNLCLYCNHANIWHSRKEKPPCDHSLSFMTSRKSARMPEYERVQLAIEIFEPRPPVLPVIEEIIYCEDIEVLPV